jgi:eukaryotic-like serine/threonine-protein kinase
MVDDMPAPGEIFGHYRVEDKLGEGAFGAVFRGEDLRLHRKVALKIPHRRGKEDAETWGRLLREARAASALNHPNICAIYDIGEEDDRNYIALEYVEGRTLSDVIRDGPFPALTALTYAGHIATALAHAHGRGIVHRDLKGSNVVITAEGQAKLLDFGLARRLDSHTIEALTQSRQSLVDIGGAAGTLSYMAPEVLRGKPAGVRSDLWSLGALLHESLCGKLPFQGETPFELSLAIMLEEPKPLPDEVPARARAIVAQCLQKEPTKRYETAQQVAVALEEARSTLGVKPALWFRRWLRMGSISLILAAGLTFVWLRHRETAIRAAPPGVAVVQAPAPHQSLPPSPDVQNSPSVQHPAQNRQSQGTAGLEVWVNVKSGIYHCSEPPSHATGNWKAMSQIEAEKNGYRASRNKPCE